MILFIKVILRFFAAQFALTKSYVLVADTPEILIVL